MYNFFMDSILFHWSIRMPLCQYHTVLISVALLYMLKTGSVSVTLFFLKVALAIWKTLVLP